MMSALLARGEAIGRASQRRQLEQIASAVRALGSDADQGSDSVICSGRRLVLRWLSDPALRFIGRHGE